MNKWIFIVLLLVGCLIGSWIFFLTREPKVIEKVIVEERVDTLKIIKPVPSYVTLKDYVFFDFPVDSIVYVHDTDTVQIPIPIEEKTFTDDSTYKCVISGFHTNLDYIEVYNKTTTITNNVIKKPILVLGPSVSIGYDPFNKSFGSSLGISIVIPVYSVYR